jgi:tRNA ligase
MAVTVEDVRLEAEGAGGGGQAGAEFVAMLGEDVRRRLHITVGTRDVTVAAVEARALVEAWRAGEGGVKSMKLDGLEATGRIRGLFG